MIPRILGCFLCLIVLGRLDVQAQDYQYVHLTDWPAEATEEADRYPYDLLPFLDSLSLGYAFSVENEQPILNLSLAWKPGRYGVLNNRKVPYDRLPDDLRLVAVDLSAEVVVEGVRVAWLEVLLDSLVLGPAPEVYAFSWEGLTWENVFSDVPPEAARTYFDEGFTLQNLALLRVAFASYDEDDGEDRPRYDPRYPTDVYVYPPRVGIWVDWLVLGNRGSGKQSGDARPAHKPRTTVGRTIPSDAERPRRRGVDSQDTEDRTERTRTGDRGEATAEREEDRKRSPKWPTTKSDDDADDADDDTELMPAALAGAAAVAVVAFGGGTVGYYGNTEAPIGLTSGYVRPRGGVLLQVAVNEAVFSGDGSERGLGRVLAFYDLLHAPIQPALGFGVMGEERDGEVEFVPSLSFGFAGNLGPLVLTGGYDLAASGYDFGVAFNFRSRVRRW